MSQLALQPLPDVHSPSKTGPGRNPQGLVQSRDAAAPAAAPAQAEAADVPVAAVSTSWRYNAILELCDIFMSCTIAGDLSFDRQRM